MKINKEWFKITPTKRIWFACGTGWFFALMIDAFTAGLRDEGSEWVYIIWAIAALVLSFINALNIAAFEKETMWMIIKNPAKVNREADEDNISFPGGSVSSAYYVPTRSPPPTKPPKSQ